jgi:hypothetical protein
MSCAPNGHWDAFSATNRRGCCVWDRAFCEERSGFPRVSRRRRSCDYHSVILHTGLTEFSGSEPNAAKGIWTAGAFAIETAHFLRKSQVLKRVSGEVCPAVIAPQFCIEPAPCVHTAKYRCGNGGKQVRCGRTSQPALGAAFLEKFRRRIPARERNRASEKLQL